MSDVATAAPVQDQSTTVDIAAMMAKEGLKTDDSPVTYTAQNNTPPSETPPAEPTKAQEPGQTETVTPPPAPEAPRAPEPPKAAPPVQQAPAPIAEPDWREIIKQQPEVEVLKHFGLDEKMINFLSRWRSGEDLKGYLEAATVDYSKMSNEEVLRRHLFKDFGELSAEDFEEVYRMKVIEQYKLDPEVFDEKEVRRGKLLLGVDAAKIRQEFVNQQQALLLSKPPAPDNSAAEAQALAEMEQQAQFVQAYKSTIETNPYTRELLSSSLLKIGDGDKAFNLEVSRPNDLIDLLYDPQKWSRSLVNEDGTPNVRKQLILAAIANDDVTFFNNYNKHYEMLGAKNIADKIANATEPAPGSFAQGSAEANNPIAQLARFGTITSGD